MSVRTVHTEGEEDARWRFAGARVWLNVVETAEDLDCRIAFDAIVFAKICLFCAVNFHQRNVPLFQRRRSFLIFRRESLAVTAPGRKEFGQD